MRDLNCKTLIELRVYIEMMVTFGYEGDTKIIYLKFLVVSRKSVYNCILGRPFDAMLDIMASLVQLKMKYKVNGELMVICVR